MRKAQWLLVFVIAAAAAWRVLAPDNGYAQGKKLTVVTSVTVGERAVGGRENTYPAVHEWDWRNNKQIELIGGSPAK